MSFIRVLAAQVAFIILAGCTSEIVELETAPSPSGKVVAILEQDSGLGAFDPFTYDVRLELAGARARAVAVTLRWVSGEEGKPIIDLSWRDDDTLLVEFFEASEIIGYKKLVRLGDREISIVLIGKLTND